MDFNALWSRASAAASEVATAAQEQASRAAAAAQEQAELFQGSDTFATVEKALADIAANTVAVAEQSERNFQAMLAEEADKSRARALAESTPKAFGVDEDLEAFLQGLTKETFAAFPLDEEQVPFRDEASSSRLAASEASVVPGTNAPEPETRTRTKSSQGGLVTPWRETHARLALANVPRLRILRDELVPDAMDDDAFWTVYFAVCAPRLAKAEARAAAAVARSRARRAAAKAERSVDTFLSRDVAGEETARDKNVAEKEKEAFLDDDVARDAETDPAGAAAALAAAFGDEEGDASPSDASPSRASGSAREDEDEEDDEDAPAAGDLDAYLNDLLGGSSDEDDEDAPQDARAPADDPPPARVSTSEKTHPLPRADE